MYEEQPLVAVRIKDGIFCGNVTAAYDEDFLIMNKVTHIVNCAGGETRDLYKNSGIQYINFPWSQPQSPTSGPNLFDQSDKNIESIIYFIDQALANGECVLVQSVHGRSRSCAMVAAYFIIKYRWTLDHALDFIAMAHEDMEIHPLFRKQLAQFYQRHEVPASQTGRALDIFHPEIDEENFALDNEQWMLRNTYVNGLVNETQERTDLYKVATARVVLAEPNPKAAAKRRRRITFCDTKQGTSVACMWTQPIVQPRNPTPVITPPTDIGSSIVARPGTPNTHRLEGEAVANVHTATPITARSTHASMSSSAAQQQIGRGSTFKLQLRSNIMSTLNQHRQQQQDNSNSNNNNTMASGLSLHRDSPMIGRGPALVATASLQQNQQQQQQNDSNNNNNDDPRQQQQQQQQYNQTVSRIVPQQQQQQQQQQGDNNSSSSYLQRYGRDNNSNTSSNGDRQTTTTTNVDSNIPNAFSKDNNNNNNNNSTNMNNNNKQQSAPTAANIAASLGTTGQGSLITLRGGAPLSVVSAGGNTNNSTQQQQQQPQTTLFNRNNNNDSSSNTTNNQMRPIPDANTGIRTLGNNNNNNSTTPSRPGPTLRSNGVQPGHNRNNPFTLPASGRTAHRGSPLPMQRSSNNNNNNTSSSLASSRLTGAAQRTNSPIRGNLSTTGGTTGNNAAPFGSSSTRSGGSYNSPMKSAINNTSSSLGSPRTNSPMAMNRGGSPIRRDVGGGSASNNLTSLSNYHTQQRLNAAGGPLRGNSPSSVGNRPSSPSRPLNNNNTSSSNTNTTTTGRSMLGGQTSSSQWSSSLLPSNNAGSTLGNRPRTGSPIVRSNSPNTQLRTGNNIPSASNTINSLHNPPSRPASISQQLSSHPSSHIPRQSNSPLASNSGLSGGPRRTGSPIRSGTQSSAFSTGGSSYMRTNSPLAANRGTTGGSSASGAGGGTLAEQFLYRSSANTSSSGNGRNSPMMRR